MKKSILWGSSLIALAGLTWGTFSYYQPEDALPAIEGVSISEASEARVFPASIKDQPNKAKTPAQLAAERYEFKRNRRLGGWSKPKNDSPDKYAEMALRIRTREGEELPGYAANQKIEELKKARQRSATLRTESVTWDSRGPSNVPGRARAVLPLPSDPKNTWLLGSVAGGVWKTTDAGDTWTHTTNQLPNLATTTLAMSQGVIYAGTGELSGGSIGVNGMGMFRSTDEGETWSLVEGTANDERFVNINRIIVNPNDANHIVAATSSYNRDRVRFSNEVKTWIVYSKDGGATWTTAFDGPGAIQQVIASPADFNIQYAAYGSDGVWKSTDAGETWSRSSMGMTNIMGRIELGISESNPDRIFASAQGNRTSERSDMYVSSNGGETWDLLSEENGGTNFDFLTRQGWYDNTVIVNPYNEDIVYVGGVNIWKMEVKGGATETATLIVTEDGTQDFLGFAQFTGVRFFNGAINPGAGVADADLLPIEIRFGPGVGQKAHRFTVGGQGPGVPVEDYTYEDYTDVPFEVWDTQNDRQLMVSFRDQAANGVFDLVEMSFTEDATTDSREYLFIHDLAYEETPNAAVAQNGGHVSSQHYSVFPLLPTGGTWDADNLPESKFVMTPASVAVRDRVTTNVTDAYQEFGGLNPYFMNKEQTNEGVHPDQHFLWVVKGDAADSTFQLLITNDGGIYKTIMDKTPGEQQGEWNYIGNGLVTGQFHGVDKMPGASQYMGGLQDNGTWRSPLSETIGAGTLYDPMFGGDGFDVIWNQRDPDLMMGGSQFNGFARSANRGQSWSGVVGVGDSIPSFFSPLGNSRTNPDVVYALDVTGVWRSPDFGLTWSSFDMTNEAGWQWNAGVPQVKASEAYNQVVWAGSGIGTNARMMVSQDGGNTFAPTSGYEGELLGGISGFATHTTEAYTAYALFSFAKAPKVLRTTDLGETWEDISGFEGNDVSDRGFPDVAIYDLLVMPHDPNTIWVGSEIGIIETNDNGASWHLLDSGLPPVVVYDMKISDNQVVIGTHGRGIWSTTIEDIPALSFQFPPVITSAAQAGDDGINASIDLRSDYDSTRLFLNGEYVGLLTGEGAFSANITGLSVGAYTIQIAGYKGGLPYYSNNYNAVIVDAADILDSYSTDFENGAADFTATNMGVRTEAGFEGNAVHTPHPYLDGVEHSFVLDKPIRVAAEDAFVIYDEVAIIELGSGGSSFGDVNFWDYAVVEASFNQNEWIPIADGYDASAESAWTNAYNNSQAGTSTMIRTNKLDLLNAFEAGDIIFIRFRLFADVEVNGWGWMIDNLHIQDNRAPIGSDQNLVVGIGNVLEGDVLFTVTDPDGDNLVVNTTPTTAPTSGTVTINEDGTFEYVASEDPGTDFFECEICDDRVAKECTIVRINIELNAALGYDEEVANKRLAIQAYPNPATGSTTAQYYLPQGGEAVIQILSLNGQQLQSWTVNKAKGQHEIPVSLDSYAKGMYLLRIKTGESTHLSKFLVK